MRTKLTSSTKVSNNNADENPMNNSDDFDYVHHAWSKINETFLHTLSILEHPNDIADAAPCANNVINKYRNGNHDKTRIPMLARGKIASTVTTPNMSRAQRLCIVATSGKAETLAKSDRQCSQLVRMAKRFGGTLPQNFEARPLAN